MSRDDVRLSIALLVWRHSREQDERRFSRLKYLPCAFQIFRIRVDVIRTENYEIVVDLIGGSSDRVCKPERLFLISSADLHSKIVRREILNDSLAKVPDHDHNLRNADRFQRLDRSLE